MKKVVKFYFGNPKAHRMSGKENNKFGLTVNMIGKELYSLEELEKITNKLQKMNFELELDEENDSCRNCIYLREEYNKCTNSKIRNKIRTPLSKRCSYYK